MVVPPSAVTIQALSNNVLVEVSESEIGGMCVWLMLAAWLVTSVNSGDVDIDLPFFTGCSANVCDLEQSVANQTLRVEVLESQISAQRQILLMMNDQLFDNITSEAFQQVIGLLEDRLEQQEVQTKSLAENMTLLTSELHHVGDNTTAELGNLRSMMSKGLEQAEVRNKLRERTALERIVQLENYTTKMAGDVECALGKAEISVGNLQQQISRVSSQVDVNQKINKESLELLSTRVGRAEAENQQISDNVTVELGNLRTMFSGRLEQAEAKYQSREKSALQKLAQLEKNAIKNTKGTQDVLGEIRSSVDTLQKKLTEAYADMDAAHQENSELINSLSDRVGHTENIIVSSVANLTTHIKHVDNECNVKIKHLSDNMHNTNTKNQQKVEEIASQLQIAENNAVTKLNLLMEKVHAAEKDINKKIDEKYSFVEKAEKEVVAKIQEVSAKLRVAEVKYTQKLMALSEQLSVAEDRVATRLRELDDQLRAAEKKQNDKISEQNLALNNIMVKVGQKINTHTSQVQELESLLNTSSQQINALLKQQDSGVRSEIQKQITQLQEVNRKHIQIFQENHKNLQVKLSEEHKCIQDLNQAVEQTENTLQNLQQQEAKVSSAIQEHERKVLAAISRSDAKLKNLLTQVESTNSQATKVANDANSKLQQINSELQKTKNDVVSTKQVGQNLATEVKRTEQNMQQLKTVLEQSTKNTRDVEMKVRQVQESTALSIKKLDSEVKNLDKQLTTFQEKVKDAAKVTQQPQQPAPIATTSTPSNTHRSSHIHYRGKGNIILQVGG
ncbi:hypothetical protein PR048_025131 [Dryococelus australis]|uniref:Uncharacterized protein n=1 Tax=Dryococelus australis TaxID=614101 RepID=A0ABQ9GQJ3_9NEOP|nr:hypothetical protein PR048_025131 [Dryococelus australis]